MLRLKFRLIRREGATKLLMKDLPLSWWTLAHPVPAAQVQAGNNPDWVVKKEILILKIRGPICITERENQIISSMKSVRSLKDTRDSNSNNIQLLDKMLIRVLLSRMESCRLKAGKLNMSPKVRLQKDLNIIMVVPDSLAKEWVVSTVEFSLRSKTKLPTLRVSPKMNQRGKCSIKILSSMPIPILTSKTMVILPRIPLTKRMLHSVCDLQGVNHLSTNKSRKTVKAKTLILEAVMPWAATTLRMRMPTHAFRTYQTEAILVQMVQ